MTGSIMTGVSRRPGAAAADHGAGSTVTEPVVTVAVITCGDDGLDGTVTWVLPILVLA